jgi:hypothetical protein
VAWACCKNNEFDEVKNTSVPIKCWITTIKKAGIIILIE